MAYGGALAHPETPASRPEVAVDARGETGVSTPDGPDEAGGSARDHLLGLLSDATGAAPRGLSAFLERVCEVAVSEVGVSGAGVTVMGSLADGIAGYRDQVCASDPRSRQLEDLQLTTGQGPCLDAYGAGTPVLVGDLAGAASRWPGFAPEAVATGAAAVFSLPLQVGVVRLGTLDLHRVTVGSLGRGQLSAALVLAGLATETLLEHADMSGGVGGMGGADGGVGGPSDIGWLSDVHAGVHQASGMVSVSLGVGVGEALVLIRAHAYARGEPIADVASRIVDRDLVLTALGPGPGAPDAAGAG